MSDLFFFVLFFSQPYSIQYCEVLIEDESDTIFFITENIFVKWYFYFHQKITHVLEKSKLLQKVENFIIEYFLEFVG